MPDFHLPTTTATLAERHEALWLGLSALHKDLVALGAKKPTAPVSEPVRIAAEGLLSECASFIRKRKERLPVAAADLTGLAVQLGQALAGLEDWESRHTTWDEKFNCRIWNLHTGYRPIMRLKPPAAALKFERDDMDYIRGQLVVRMKQRERRAYHEGFEAGRAARAGAPADSLSSRVVAGQTPIGQGQPAGAGPLGAVSGGPQTYPRLRGLA